MKHYRRKPLQIVNQGLPESVTDLFDNVDTLPSASDSVTIPATPEAVTETLAEVIQPVIGETEAIPSPEALVQQATAILGNDLAVPLESAQTVTSPLNLGTTTPSVPSSYSVPGLVDEIHEFVNELANLIALKSELMGGGLGHSPLSDASVPLLQPSHPYHTDETAQISFKVHNDSTETTQPQFFCSDLYSCQGDLIPRHAISIAPNNLSLAPDATDSINISIQLPQHLSTGEYSGILMVAGLPYLKAMISLEVT